MKKISILLVMAVLVGLFAGCTGAQTPPDTQPTTDPSVTDPVTEGPTTYTGVLYADFTGGSTLDEEFVKEFPFEYTGAPKTASELAVELSALTGLDFIVTVTEADGGLTVDWAKNSTLIAGLDGREQKEEFFFFDVYTLDLFMLDSLWRTLTGNLEVENIYYTMDGGKKLSLGFPSAIDNVQADEPYMGSAYYESRYIDPAGDHFAATEGTWRLDGASDTAYIEMDGRGGFIMYYASGAVENSGYMECADEYGDGALTYYMYSTDGELLCSFWFDSASRIHIGNEGGAVYILDGALVTGGEMNRYYDGNSGLVLYYPDVFSATGTLLPDGSVDFHTLWNTGMVYWVSPNPDGLTAADYIIGWGMTEAAVLDGNVLIGYGESVDHSGETVPAAFWLVIEDETVVHVKLLCTSEEEAVQWYREMHYPIFYVENGSTDAVG